MQTDRPDGVGPDPVRPDAPATVDDGSGRAAWATVLWPVAIMGHLAANPGHLLAGDAIGAAQVLLAGLAAWLIVRPGALPAGLLAGLYLVVFWLKLPVVGNHEVILALVAVAMSWGVAGPIGNWPGRAAPPCRVALIVSYGFIALSKFNDGFFDPGSSCAGLFADEMGDLVGLRPGDHRWIVLVAIWATALIEGLIPVALVIRRLRGAGVVLALSFHFLLAVDPASHVWDFSSALLPLFVLFLPAGFHRLIDGVVGRWRGRPAVERLASIGLVVALQATSLVGPLPDWLPAYPLWLAIGGAVTVAAARFVIGADGGLRWTLGGTGPDDGRRWSLGVAIVLVIGLANGLAPYAEVRTAAAFNMYSNLRIVDGDSNHFVVPALPVGLHRPMAALEDPGPDSELAFYHSAGMIVPMENLTRYATDHRDEVVVGRVGEGQSVLVEPAAGGVMGRLVDGLETKLAFRRALDADEPAACLRSWGPIG